MPRYLDPYFEDNDIVYDQRYGQLRSMLSAWENDANLRNQFSSFEDFADRAGNLDVTGLEYASPTPGTGAGAGPNTSTPTGPGGGRPSGPPPGPPTPTYIPPYEGNRDVNQIGQQTPPKLNTYTPAQLEALKAYANSSDAQKAKLAAVGGNLAAFGTELEKYWTENIGKVNPADDANVMKLLDSLDYDVSSYVPTNQAAQYAGVEEVIGNAVIDNYVLPELQRDYNQRNEIANNLQAGFGDLFSGAAEGVDDITRTQFNTQKYLSDYPDVKAAAEADVKAGKYKTLEEAAIAHYENTGRFEGRLMQSGSSQYFDELNVSNATDATQRSALDAQIASLNSAATANTAAKQDALAAQVSALNSATDANAEAKRSSLADQLSTLGAANDKLTQDRLSTIDAQTGAKLQAIDADAAAKQEAIRQQLLALNSAQSTYSEEQRAALAAQLQGKLDAITQETAAKKASLQSAVQDFLQVNDTATNDKLTALGQQTGTLLGALGGELNRKLGNQDIAYSERSAALDDEIVAKDGGLASLLDRQLGNSAQAYTERTGAMNAELATKTGALSTELGQKQSALESQIAANRAAQTGVDTSRLRAAQNQMTSVNLGVQAAQDDIRAQQAQQGFVGGSAGTDAALARAAISGRQQAAGAMSSARMSNATDARGIDMQAASDRLGLSNYGAGEQRSLTNYGADQRTAISGARTNADLASRNQYAAGKQDLTNYGANQRTAISGARTDANLANRNIFAGDERKISSDAAQQRFGIQSTGIDDSRNILNTGISANNALENNASTSVRQANDAQTDGLAGLADRVSTNRLGIATQGAADRRNLADATSTNRANVFGQQADATAAARNAGSQQSYDNATFGATQRRSIGDAAADSRQSNAVFSANQSRGLADSLADTQQSNSNYAATERRGLADSTAQRNLALFSNDTNRRLSNLTTPITLATAGIGYLDMLDDYRQSGLNRALGNLNWFNTGNTQASNAVTNQVTANTAQGDALAGLGTGLMNLGGNFAMSNYFRNSGTGTTGATTSGSSPAINAFVNDTGSLNHYANTPVG